MTSRRFDKGHRDDNESLITEVLRRYGVPYRKGSDTDGYDLLVMTSPMRLVEIKNPSQPPSKRGLTDVELVTKEWCDLNNIPYDVVETPEEMVKILSESWKKS